MNQEDRPIGIDNPEKIATPPRIPKSDVEMFQLDPNMTPDGRDHVIARDRLTVWSRKPGPRVGDFVVMPDGTRERFAYEWPKGIQTTDDENASFYLGYGYVSMSGALLNPTIPKEKLQPTSETKEGVFWFFHHDLPGYARGVGARTPCRVYRLVGG